MRRDLLKSLPFGDWAHSQHLNFLSVLAAAPQGSHENVYQS